MHTIKIYDENGTELRSCQSQVYCLAFVNNEDKVAGCYEFVKAVGGFAAAILDPLHLAARLLIQAHQIARVVESNLKNSGLAEDIDFEKLLDKMILQLMKKDREEETAHAQ
jgi:hypothetical protein